jgi:hypothetical protein
LRTQQVPSVITRSAKCVVRAWMEEIVAIATAAGLDPRNLLEVLHSGSRSSSALQLLAGEISPEVTRHLPYPLAKGHRPLLRGDAPPPSASDRPRGAHESVTEFLPARSRSQRTSRIEPAAN